MGHALDSGISGPTVDLFDSMTRALRLTCAFDLHFCDRHDPQLLRVAEELDEEVRELQTVWPASVPAGTAGHPVLEGFRRGLIKALQQVGAEASELADRLVDREPRDRAKDLPRSAIRCQQALIGLWHRLAFRCHQQADAGNLERQIPDPHVRYLLAEVRSALPAILLGGFGAANSLRELRPLDRKEVTSDVSQKLVARIAQTWRIDVGDRPLDSLMWKALTTFAEQVGLEPVEAKHRLIEDTLEEVLRDLDHRIEVRVGQQWRKQVPVPIRSTRDGDDSVAANHEWANNVASQATPEKARFWVEELPFYRRWKWVVSKTIGRAERTLKIAYGPDEKSPSTPDDEAQASAAGPRDATANTPAVDETAEIEARLRATEAVKAVAEAGLTQRQAEVWLRQADLPPAVRLKLADGLGINVPDHHQTRQQVADDLEIAPGTVGSHLHRAREKLPRSVGAI